MDPSQPHYQEHSHRTWYSLAGAGLCILGTVEILFAWASTLFSVLYLGFFAIALGIFEGIQAINMRGWKSVILHAALSILYIVAGCSLVAHPAANALTLTFILALFFIISGAAKIAYAVMAQQRATGWLVADGLISILLGSLIWAQWPGDSIWVIGTLVGINTLLTGITWLMGGIIPTRRTGSYFL